MKKNNLFIISLILITLFSSCNRSKEIKLYPVKIGDNYQYIDNEGKIVIQSKFGAAGLFSDNGLALVKTLGEYPKFGYITDDGKYAIMPKYKYATDFNEGLAWVVTENEPPKAINSKGEIKIVLRDAEIVGTFHEGLAGFVILDNGEQKWGFVDKDGKIKINPQFYNVDIFSNGRCAVTNKDGKSGYINTEGKMVINYQFDEAASFHENNMACVKLGDKWGVIDENGKYAINPQFSNIGFDGEYFRIEQDEKWGWCDKNGKIIINPQFESIHSFNYTDLAAVKSGSNWGYIGKDGNFKINPQFEDAFRFNGNIAIVKTANKYGFINKNGKYVINPQYEDISPIFVGYVETDYFNTEAVTSKIDLTSLGLNSTFDEVIKKLNLSNFSFEDDNHIHQTLIRDKEITKDVSYSFVAYGDAFKIQDRIIIYLYDFKLTGKGIGKSKKLIASFVNKLTGFKKGKTDSYSNMYFDKTTKIIFTGYGNSLSAMIAPAKGSEVEDNNPEIVEYESEGCHY